MIETAELIEYLEADAGDTAVLEQLERAAAAFVSRQTGRYFGEPAEHSITLVGSGSRRLWLPDAPIDPEVPADPLVTIEERAYPGEDPTTLVIDTDFALRGSELIRLGGYSWTRGYEYEATYRRGYEPGTEPEDIRQLVLDLVSVRFAMHGREAMRSEGMGGYSYTRFGDSDLDAVMGGDATINAWRVPVVA